MSRTVIGRCFTLRSFLIIVSLLAAMAAPLTSESAWAAVPSTCAADGRGYMRLSSGGSMCVLERRYVDVPGSGAVRMSGSVKVDDSGRPRTTSSRYFFYGKILCYDSSGDEVFRIGASRNIWTGIGRTGLYPGSVFAASPGRYLCTLQARQKPVGRSSIPRNWYIARGNRALGATPFTYDGGSSPGPNMDPWPSARPNLTPASGTVTAASKQFDLPLGLSSYVATSTTSLSGCHFSGDIRNGRMCSSVNPSKPVVANIRLHARQLTSPLDSSPCGPALRVDRRQAVDALAHHFTVVLSGTLDRSLACTGPFVVKNEVKILSGRGYLGAGVKNSTKRYGTDLAVGAGW